MTSNDLWHSVGIKPSSLWGYVAFLLAVFLAFDTSKIGENSQIDMITSPWSPSSWFRPLAGISRCSFLHSSVKPIGFYSSSYPQPLVILLFMVMFQFEIPCSKSTSYRQQLQSGFRRKMICTLHMVDFPYLCWSAEGTCSHVCWLNSYYNCYSIE